MSTISRLAIKVERKPLWLIPLLFGILLMFGPYLGMDPSWTRQFMLIAIFTLVVSGLNLSFGYAGELSLGQVAIYAASAYVAGFLSIHGHGLIVEMAAAVAVAAVLGFASGIPGARLAGWGLAMSSFFLVLLVPDVVALLGEWTGGYSGLAGIMPPTLFGRMLEPNQFYMVVIGTMIVWVAIVRNLVTSRHGKALQVLRQSPILASSLGINVYRTKMTAYVLGAIPAGLAGALFAHVDLYLAPESFTFQLAIAFIAASVLGGSESVYGAFVGAFLLQVGPMQTAGFAEYALVAYGAFLIIGGVLLPGGAAGLARTAWARIRTDDSAQPDVRPSDESVRPAVTPKAVLDLPPITGKPLRVSNLVQVFGGVRALDDVTIAAQPGQVTGLIGGNGSGKTTLLNIVSGFYRPTSGTVELDGGQLGNASPHKVARLGVARTFQTPLIPRNLTTLEVLCTARYARHYSSLLSAALRLPGYRRQAAKDRERGMAVLDVLGITHLADVQADSLPLGSRRVVEVARALVAEPAVLLLDEPASGLDGEEVEDLARVVRSIAALGTTVILVEHNFELICRVSDHVHVLEFGKLIASGTPEQIQDDPAVQRSYLGEELGAGQETSDDELAFELVETGATQGAQESEKGTAHA